MDIKSILKTYSNSAIATVSGYNSEIIHLLRKNQVDTVTIKRLPSGVHVPVKSVLENRIVESFENWKKAKKERESKILSQPVCEEIE